MLGVWLGLHFRVGNLVMNYIEDEELLTKRELIEELKLEVNPKREITRYTHCEFNLIFIECIVLNIDNIQLNEHLDYRWINENEFQKFDFLQGDLRFTQKYNELKDETIQIK